MSNVWQYEIARKAPKKQKKTVKNPFHYYMKEYNETKLGGKVTDWRKLSQMASESWNRMDPNEKRKYEVLANKGRQNIPLEKPRAEDELLQLEIEKKESIKQALEDTIRLVSGLDAATTLQTHDFYMFHANAHIRTHSGIVVPCELAISRYSIQKGVSGVFHRIVNIRAIPLGYAASAKDTAEATHRLPVSHKDAETNVVQLFRDILRFLLPKTDLGSLQTHEMGQHEFPPMFAQRDVLELARECLAAVIAECSLAENLDCRCLPMLNVYPVDDLVHQILRKITSSVQMGNSDLKEEKELMLFVENPSFIVAKFHKDIYSQAPEITCNFHEENDCRLHCSKSRVVRMTYNISDYCCNILGVVRRKKYHYPTNHPEPSQRLSKPIFLNASSSRSVTPVEDPFPRQVQPGNYSNRSDTSDSMLGAAGNWPPVPSLSPVPMHSPAPVLSPVPSLLTHEPAADWSRDPIANWPRQPATNWPPVPFGNTMTPEPTLTPRMTSSLPAQAVRYLPQPTTFVELPTRSILSDEEDDDDTCSTFSRTPSSIYTSRALGWSSMPVKKERTLPTASAGAPPLDQPQKEVAPSHKPSASYDHNPTERTFGIESRPEMEYMRRKVENQSIPPPASVIAPSEAESLASIPLARYKAQHIPSTPHEDEASVSSFSPFRSARIRNSLDAEKLRLLAAQHEEERRVAEMTLQQEVGAGSTHDQQPQSVPAQGSRFAIDLHGSLNDKLTTLKL